MCNIGFSRQADWCENSIRAHDWGHSNQFRLKGAFHPLSLKTYSPKEIALFFDGHFLDFCVNSTSTVNFKWTTRRLWTALGRSTKSTEKLCFACLQSDLWVCFKGWLLEAWKRSDRSIEQFWFTWRQRISSFLHCTWISILGTNENLTERPVD